MPDKQTFAEAGVSGLAKAGGLVREEFLPQLQGAQGRKVYAEMRDNDPVIGAMLHLIAQMLLGATWDVSGGEEEAQDFLGGAMEDMSHTWQDFLDEVTTYLVWGWDLAEIVYKKRQGPKADPRSRYADGKIGWRKLAPRSQMSLDHWEFDEGGGIRAMVQRKPEGGLATIPIQKALLFRTTTRLNSPEGRSILRPSYKPYYYLKRLQEIEAVGIERDLTGYPVIYLPKGWEAADLTKAEAMVTRMKRDELEGMVLPGPKGVNLETWEEGGWLFELIGSPGGRQLDIGGAIQRYEQRMAMSVLVQFIFLGISGVGSYSLAETMADVFHLSLQGWANGIASVLNRFAVPRLFELNGAAQEDLPQFTVSVPSRTDLAGLAGLLQMMFAVGYDLSDLGDHIRGLAGLPAMPQEEAEKAVKEMTAMPGEDERRLAEFAKQLARRRKKAPFGEPLPEEEALGGWEITDADIQRAKRVWGKRIPELRGELEEG